MTNQLVPIILNLIASVFGAYGQWLYKIGALKLTDQPIWKNYPFLGGMACFTAVMLLFMAGFRLGGRWRLRGGWAAWRRPRSSATMAPGPKPI